MNRHKYNVIVVPSNVRLGFAYKNVGLHNFGDPHFFKVKWFPVYIFAYGDSQRHYRVVPDHSSDVQLFASRE
jgi:hypothetical protein